MTDRDEQTWQNADLGRAAHFVVPLCHAAFVYVAGQSPSSFGPRNLTTPASFRFRDESSQPNFGIIRSSTIRTNEPFRARYMRNA